MDTGGLDSEGRGFSSAHDMWREELGLGDDDLPHDSDNNSRKKSKRHEWYSKGISYWEGVEASVDGVLGGYGHVNDADVKGSDAFLRVLLSARFGAQRRHLAALDCGSGVGRVTKNLLLRHFNEVDLVEPVSHFLDAARNNLVQNIDTGPDDHKAVNFYCIPLQDFTPEAGRYDVIWVQWCIGHLPDDDFVAFFKRAKVGLKPNGFFVVKENVAKDGFVLDRDDMSVTRSDSYLKELFDQCGLYIYSMKEQKGLPEELFRVKMYALLTSKPTRVNSGRAKKQRNTPAVIKS